MDLSPSAEQVELVRSVRRVVERRGAAAPLPVRSFDAESLDALDAAGLLDVVVAGGSPLDAALAVEEAARHGVGAPVAARALVAPVLFGAAGAAVAPPGRCIALADRAMGALVRFGAEADQVLAIDGDDAVVGDGASGGAVSVLPADSRWGYPLARVTVDGGVRLPGAGARLRRLWRIALAAEAAGLLQGAVARAAEHVSTRQQFGRPIGAYQAVQHRLARSKVIADGTAWLARRAAWDVDDELWATRAATFAADGMREVVPHVQQVCGAIGLTDEFGLTRLTGKMLVLSTELGGGAAHARDHARARFRSGREHERRPAPGYRGRGVRP